MNLTVLYPTEVCSFDFQVECADRTVQYKLNAQSLRLFGIHREVNDAHRAGANQARVGKLVRCRAIVTVKPYLCFVVSRKFSVGSFQRVLGRSGMSLRMSRDLFMFGSRKAHVCSLFFSFQFLFHYLKGSLHSGRWKVTRVTVGRDTNQSFRVCKVTRATLKVAINLATLPPPSILKKGETLFQI